MKKLLALLALTFVIPYAYATPFPTQFEILTLESPLRLYTPKYQAEVIRSLQQTTNAIAGGSVSLPDKLSLYVVDHYGNAFFDPISNSIVSPYQLRINGSSKHPNFSRSVVMHEYGHAVFNDNLPIILKKKQAQLAEMKAFQREVQKFKKERAQTLVSQISLEVIVEQIHERGINDENHPLIVEGNKIDKQNEEQMAILESKISAANQTILEESMKTMEELTALNEFFADVVAVVVTGDPNTIMKATHFIKLVEEVNPYDRAFRRRASRRPLNMSPHDFYSLSREYIFKYYLSDAGYRLKGKPWLIRKTLEAVGCAFEKNTENLVIFDQDSQRLPNSQRGRYVLEKMNNVLNVCVDQSFGIQ